MAIQTKVHADLQPVANFDAREYTVGSLNDVTSGATVQPQGPKLDFFTIAKSSNAAHWTGAEVKGVIDAIQQLGIVYLYKYTAGTNGSSADTLAVAVYPTGAWTTSTLDTATGGSSSATATF